MGEVRRGAQEAVCTAQSHLRQSKKIARAGMQALAVSGPVPRWLYGRLGRRYPIFVLTLEFAVAHLVVLGALGVLALFVPMTLDQFLRILIVAEVLVGIENVFATHLAAKMLRPVTAWLDGDRTQESTVAAWTALAELPIKFFRRWGWVSLICVIPPIAAFITWELSLPTGAFFLVLLASVGVLAYGALGRFFAVELILRPVMEDISAELPEDFQIERTGVPLKWKIMIALPMVNIVTSVVVAGLIIGGSGGGITGNVALTVVIAVAVAALIALEVNVLLSRAMLTPLLNLRRATERLAEGDLSARVALVSTDETGQLAQAFNRMAAGLEERERLREAFGAFVDPDVADRIMAEGALEGEEVEVTLLFVDIRDFTAFAEQAAAHEVVARLNHFYERVVPVLTRHGGHASKFVGDGLLGVFGTPEVLPDHADRGIAAALDIADLVATTYGDDLRVGIGVNSGPVLAGTIGGGGRLDFTVIGDPVNTASRVEHVTRETGDVILVTEATRCLLTREFGGFEERSGVELRGKAEAVRLWAPMTQAAATRGREEMPREPSESRFGGVAQLRRRRRRRVSS